jgi:hypothetical protein
LLLEETLHTASKQIEEKIRGTSNINAENSNVQETFSLPEQYTQVASLKKKEKKEGVSKQKKSWTEKFKKKKKNKGKKKNPSNPVQQEDGIHVPESQAYESISSFIQILMVCLLHLSFSIKIAFCVFTIIWCFVLYFLNLYFGLCIPLFSEF